MVNFTGTLTGDITIFPKVILVLKRVRIVYEVTHQEKTNEEPRTSASNVLRFLLLEEGINMFVLFCVKCSKNCLF